MAFNQTVSLADALRRRAQWLELSPGRLEYGWGDKNIVIAGLFELADVLDSWSGEYLSKEDAHEEWTQRRWGYTDENNNYVPGDCTAKPLTKEERRAAVRK
jgi:hypothetical protein